MTLDSISEKNCTNVFAHNDEELTETFTRLWTQIINKKESESNQVNIANTSILDL